MALSQADVLAGLKEIVEEVAGIPAASIELGKNFTDDLEVVSLNLSKRQTCEHHSGSQLKNLAD